MWRRWLPGVALSLAVLTATGVLTYVNAQQADEMAVNDPQIIQKAQTVPQIGAKLEPVPIDTKVPLGPDDALAIARKDGYGENDGASEVTPLLALFTSARRSVLGEEPIESAPTKLEIQDQLAWVLRFDGVCVPVLGPPDPESPKCAGEEINVVVNAETGSLIEAYSYSD